MKFFQIFCFIRKVLPKSCRMSSIGVFYDQNSRFSLFLKFFKNMVFYKGGELLLSKRLYLWELWWDVFVPMSQICEPCGVRPAFEKKQMKITFVFEEKGGMRKVNLHLLFLRMPGAPPVVTHFAHQDKMRLIKAPQRSQKNFKLKGESRGKRRKAGESKGKQGE